MGWGDLPKEPVIYDEDLPRRNQPVPRFIPEQVLEQIFLHLEQLEPNWQRMFRVAYEVGMRISELLSLPYNCLTQDATGGWWIQYVQEKVKAEQTQPISKETAAVIQTQQLEVQAKFGHQPKLLFPNPKDETILYPTFIIAINRFIIEHNIRDASGRLWRFQPHQLRHSFGTRHINSGMPILTLKRMMGHKTEAMTEMYAHLHDQTLRAKFEQSRQDRKLVDITGRVIAQNSLVDTADLQWLKRWLKSHLNTSILSNGYCALPVVLGDCPAPDTCLMCQHFRTDTSHLPLHEKQLVETIRLIEEARSRGWERQVKNNERIARNLKTIIASLKEENDDAQPQG